MPPQGTGIESLCTFFGASGAGATASGGLSIVSEESAELEQIIRSKLNFS